ncbi:cytochrome b5-like heme/steroid binding domain-containing protein [Podospora appendiculata]|uniref:Cytochrome b5-like heme/steroid binding domain-containing protein n=1 Tax=Podospora appendiculata TaxID=314037 RepID=A0AAE1CE34_9PEZI|nr:cytochrome b5-like heme/steroid binding domain-containing protein [Podospora appendiculata]
MATLSWEQVKAHSTEAEAWIVLHGSVYNATPFLEDHPGGRDLILDVAGQDATEVFEEAAHSSDARDILPGLLVGRLKEYNDVVPTSHSLIGRTAEAEKSSNSSSSLTARWTAVLSLVAFAWFMGARSQNRQDGHGDGGAQSGSDNWTVQFQHLGGVGGAAAVASANPLWVLLVVVLLSSVWGFGVFISYVIYVDYGRLDKYPARTRLE